MATIGKTNPHAAKLRQEATDAERRLWRHLRNRNLGGFKFRRQVTIGPFIADFACVEIKLIVEADGGQHGGDSDTWRTHYLEALGWKVLRFWNHEILLHTDAVLEAILRACQAAPPAKGEGGLVDPRKGEGSLP
jgi:very-short-patch-repair endonuclease